MTVVLQWYRNLFVWQHNLTKVEARQMSFKSCSRWIACEIGEVLELCRWLDLSYL